MKNIVLATIALSALVTVGRAGAADAPAAFAAKAPAVSPGPTWTGFYLGGHIGAGFAYRDWEFADRSVTSDSADAFIGGGQIGFNYQIGKWVLGAEADLSWGNLSDQSVCPDGLRNCRTRETWLGTTTARFGYAFDPALFYLKGGAAFTHADHFKEGPITSPLDEAGEGYRAGWTLGAGMEYALTRNWSVKFEYDYLDFGTRSVAMHNAATGAFAENAAITQRAHEAKFGFNYHFNDDLLRWPLSSSSDDAKSQSKPSAAKEPEPKRRGLAAPFDSPPFPSSDYPLGGSQVIGVPDTSVGALMKRIYDGPYGQAWKDSRVKIYGWAEFGANASTSAQSNVPAGYAIRPNRGELEQFVLRIERLPDTVQKDHVDWGFNVSSIYGLDYRYTVMKGIFSDQLLKHNNIYGYDIPTFYGDVYIPWVADGMNVRFGRYLSVPDIETQLASGNYMYTHSLLYIYDPFTQMGVVGTVKLNDQWLVQFGAHAGNDVAIWEGGDAKFTPMACIRWTSKDNKDSLYPCINSINDGKYAYDNIQMFVATWSHKFNDKWNMQTEAYYTYQRDVPAVGGPLPIEPNTNGAVCPPGQIACFAPAWAVVNYLNHKISKTDYVVLRNEFFDDDRGQRTGTKTRYTTHGIGWGHWFNVWGENTALFRSEIRYEHAYDAPAYDLGTKKDQLMLAADLILLY